MIWRKRRQVLYSASAAVIVLGALFYFGYQYFSTPGSCYDRTQNDGELGVDCGGPCARLCSLQTHDPVVLWSRALLTAPGTYTAVAYVRNPQFTQGAVSYNVGYTFRLFGENNHLIIEQTGTTDLPAIPVIPITAPNIRTGSLPVAHTQFSFTTSPIIWVKISKTARPDLSVKNVVFADDGQSLSATVVNETNDRVGNVSVQAVLFDATGNAVAASRSLVQLIGPEGQDTVVFTWPVPIAGVVREEVTPLPELPKNPQP